MPTLLLASAALFAPSLAFAEEGAAGGADDGQAAAQVEAAPEEKPAPPPAEEAPPAPKVEEVPPPPKIEEAPPPPELVQDTPAQEAPAQETPAQDAPAQDAPKQDDAAQDTTAADTPAGAGADEGAEQIKPQAAPDPEALDTNQVVVCKYTFTPGPDEQGRTVLISNVSALGNDWNGNLPFEFGDEQERSIATRHPKNSEKAKDLDLDAECPAIGQAEPVEIAPPVLDVTDECGVGNAVYGEVPESDQYTIDRDGNDITLTAADGFVFAGDLPTYTYPALVETNTEECEDTRRVIVCKLVTTPAGTLHHIIIPNVNSLELDGWDGVTFGVPFGDAQDSFAVRYAEEGDTPQNVSVESCVNEPVVIPALAVLDECGVGNATYGDVPESPQYTTEINEDGSITLTAAEGFTFTTGETTFTYPAPEETNIDACPVSLAVVACVAAADDTSPVSARRAPVALGEVVVLDLETALANGFLGDFPYFYTVGDAEFELIRYAAPGETAEDIDAIDLCGEVAGIVDVPKDKDDVPDGEVDRQVTAGLPNTGGPPTWLVPMAALMVLAGSALIVARRPHSA